MTLLQELKRRNVIRVGVFYAVAAWLLLQVTDVLVSILELPPWSGKLVVLFLAIGFPIVLVFSWIYELTPEGIKRESTVDRSESITGQTGQKLNIAIVVLLVIAIAGLVLDRILPEQAPGEAMTAEVSAPDHSGAPAAASSPGNTGSSDAPAAGEKPATSGIDPKSVAVLPFVNMSNDPDNEYFSDGLTEELLNVLARMDGLKVAARTSSFRFKGKVGDMAEIGQQLRVATLLEGSVRRAGERVRVTAQLINAKDGYHLWSNTYDREMDDIFAIQDEVAHEVAKALQVALLGGDNEPLVEKPTDNIEAYQAYLKAGQAMHRQGYEGFAAAERAYQQAIELDPGFSAAYSGLAYVEAKRAMWGETDFATGAVRIEPLVDRALALDGDNAVAWAGRGLAQLFRYWSNAGPLEAARPALDRALELAPEREEVGVLRHYFLLLSGRVDEAIRLQKAALERDPLSPQLHMSVGNILVRAGRYAEAEPYYRRLDELVERDPTAPYGLSMIAGATGRFADSIRFNAEAFRRDPSDHEYLSNIAGAYLDVGDPARARAFLEAERAIAPDAVLTRATEALIDYFEGNLEAAAAIADAQLVSSPGGRLWSEGAMLLVSMDYHLPRGEADAVAAHFEARLPGVTSTDFEIQDVNAFNWRVGALPVVSALHGQAVAADAAGRALVWIRAHPEAAVGNDANLATAYAALGDAEAFIRHSEAAGYWGLWATLRSAYAAPVRNSPEFEVLQRRLNEMAARARASLAGADDRPDPKALLALNEATETRT